MNSIMPMSNNKVQENAVNVEYEKCDVQLFNSK